MKKVIRLVNLDCANCAAKMEAGIAKINGVDKVTISFMTQRMTIECDEAALDSILETANQVIRKIEPECTMVGF